MDLTYCLCLHARYNAKALGNLTSAHYALEVKSGRKLTGQQQQEQSRHKSMSP